MLNDIKGKSSNFLLGVKKTKIGGVKITKIGVTIKDKIVIKKIILILADRLFLLFKKKGLFLYLSKGLQKNNRADINVITDKPIETQISFPIKKKMKNPITATKEGTIIK